MKKILAAILLLPALNIFAQQKTITITKEQLKDKIMGGWAGQTIGVTFGGPYEFRFSGSFIQDYQPLTWYDGYLRKTMVENPGLYDDLYMDLTFVDVFDRYGLDAPVDSFANAFAHAGYMLWHANQAARYNILNGIKAPQSGNWLYNPHSDDIDYQIESDFAGLMSPGMPNTASAISDKIGHIMNYGDGWYGGVFIGAMYSLAFTSRNISQIVSEALKTIPARSTFYQCILDVIKWHKQYPANWQQTWLEIQKKWASDVACPEGVFSPFDIDSKINSAYVVLGLLYGNGDYTKSLDITTRAGQDADCNPSSVGGILGTMIGYRQIPAYWKMGLKEAEDIDFKYTTMSLNKVYDISYRHALANVERNGGKVNGNNVAIALQLPKTVKFEQGFQGMYPVDKKWLGKSDFKELNFEFEGTGFAVRGEAEKKKNEASDYVFEAELYIDGQKVETAKLPTSFTTRRHELFWKYGLQNKKHSVTVKILNPDDNYAVNAIDYIFYNDKPPATNRWVKICSMNFPRAKFISICILYCSLACNQQSKNGYMSQEAKGTYSYDAKFLKQYSRNVVELYDKENKAKILLSAEYQGRVMTSTAMGDSGSSFGWIKYDLVSSGNKKAQFNPVGGEERFWLGPEGGQYSIYFRKNDSFNISHWQVPGVIDTIPYDISMSNDSMAVFSTKATLVNYSGTTFNISIQRRISLMSNNGIEQKLNVKIPADVHAVGYETDNQVKNVGKENWQKEKGLLSIWLLGMMTPTEQTKVIIPFKPIQGARSLITTNYFGNVPPDRLDIKDSVLYFTCDGKFRSKIGLSPLIAKSIAASFDFKRDVLTLILFPVDSNGMYVNSKWELQKEPYKGDVVNSYNDGPLADGSQLGPFYEIESSSSAKELAIGEIQEYRQVTCHLQGNYESLREFARKLLGVDLDDLKK